MKPAIYTATGEHDAIKRHIEETPHNVPIILDAVNEREELVILTFYRNQAQPPPGHGLVIGVTSDLEVVNVHIGNTPVRVVIAHRRNS
jgi:hypothetical protein